MVPAPDLLPEPISFPSQIISAEWLVANIGKVPDLRIVDMRPRAAYLAGHIPGAVNLPWDTLRVTQAENVTEVRRTIEDFESLMGQTLRITRETPVVIYAAVGTHAARLLWELNLHGNFDVAVLNGQFPAWTAAGGAVSVKEAPRGEPAFFVSRFQPHLLLTNHFIANILDVPGYVIVDTRVTPQFAGIVPGPGIAPERAGHIPNAINWVAAEYYAAGIFMPVDKFVAKAAERGITKDKIIIGTCRSGHTATALYILLAAAGFNNVALHDHSWLGWNIEDYLPRARK
jgi:thiosulfate/3-mercaptopyruvate sulfurtransferase